MSQFDELLSQLKAAADEQETMAKALPADDGEDDEAIQAAADEGNPDAEEDAEGEHAEPDGDEGAEGKEPMAKSMTAIIDGEEVEAIDATELIKSLGSRVDTAEAVLAKALESTLGTIKTQGEMIKSLSARLDKLAGQGKGRKTVLSVVEKPAAGEQPLAKSEQGLTPQEFMAKAMDAFKAGKLSGQEVTTADVAIRSGQPVPAGIIAKALS